MISSFDSSGKSVTIDGQRKAAFTFDRVFGPDSIQEELYNYAAKPVVEDVLKGYNGTIFAYGQTSSGKTHTMEGPDIDGPDRGIIPRIVQNIFQYIELAPVTLEFTVRVTYFEIYMEKIRDLLCDGNDNLQIHENRERGVYVRHATELFMQDTEEVMEVMRSGAMRRSVASTNMNDISSRSHSVFLMDVTQKDTVKGGVKSGHLYLVDLAGSEKVSKTGADGEVLEEAKNINKSLSALGLVIMSLTDGQSRHHVPYRDSKLTRILQESLGGNSRTTIIICCSPSSYNEQETFSSLRFGKRAKSIKNCAVVNVQYSAEELQKQLDVAKKEIGRMAKLLAAAEAELQLWRSGQTVSEESRIALTQNAGAEPAADGEGATGPGMSDQERDDILRRETELLDMLDAKDEEIRSLQRELDILSKDKVVITSLASENASLRNKVKDLEEQNDDFLAETTEYEVTIEDMARVNQELADRTEAIKKEKDDVEGVLTEQMQMYEKLMGSVAEGIAQLVQGKTTRPASGGDSFVDTHMSKARSYVGGLQSEITQIRKARSEVDEELKQLRAEEEKMQKNINELQMSLSQAESKVAESSQRLSATTQKCEDLKHEKALLEGQLAELVEKLGGVKSELFKTKQEADVEADRGTAKAEEIRLVLEKQKEHQRQQHAEQLAALQSELESAQTEKYALTEEKGRLALQVEQLKSDLEKKIAQLAQTVDKLETQEKRVQQEQKARVETQALTEQTSRQLDNCDALRTRLRETLLQRLRRPSGELAVPAASGSTPALSVASGSSALVASLEKTNRDLQQTLQEAQKSLIAAQRESSVAEKQSQAQKERIRNLEMLLKGSDDRLQKFLDSQQHLADTRRNAERSQQRTVQRTKSSKPATTAQPVVQRSTTARSSTDPAKSDFWREQGSSAQQPAGSRLSVSSSASSSRIVNQGSPLVGPYASAPMSPVKPEPKPQEKLMSVEFV